MSESPLQLTPEDRSERRRPGWAGFRHSHPGVVATMAVALVLFLAMDVWIVARRFRYRSEITRLRSTMTDLERKRTDEIVSQEQNKLRLAIELLRRQAQVEKALHLTVSLDSGAMYLEREGALLREMPVVIGPDRQVGVAPDTVRLAAPRGVRTIARVLTDDSRFDVALMLDGGTMIYSPRGTAATPDSASVLPGSVRARPEDLRAILPNLSAGTRVYFY